MTCEIDIDPDDLIPAYLDTRAKLFALGRVRQQGRKKVKLLSAQEQAAEDEEAKLQAKLARIENDVLFDKFVAEQQWKVRRVALEKEIAAERQVKAQERAAETETSEELSNGDVNDEADRIAAEILAQGDDDDDDEEALADLFANLPTNEVDPTTGKTTTVVNGADGVKVVIRDFGKWTGMSPQRVLEEACRSRYVACNIVW